MSSAAAAAAASQQDADTQPQHPMPTAAAKPDGPQSHVPVDHLHSLLLLSDSALPLGSFAFSSGLESFLSHRPKRAHNVASFNHFLALSLASVTTMALPYVVAAYNCPQRLEDLDNDFDASTTCTVARRASVKQGRALIAVWERSFRAHASGSSTDQARATMDNFCTAMKTASESNPFSPNGHLAPLFGVLCAVLHVPLPHVLYMFLMNHAKTLVSAGIRSSVLGPYQAQGILASMDLQSRISSLVQDELQHNEPANSIVPDGKRLRTEDAGQCVPMLDLWGGRHEIVYSRIFNS